jgi:hypothetical protein
MQDRASTPHITRIKNGWAAVGHGWAVFGASREEALGRYAEAETKHAELRQRTTQDANAAAPLAAQSRSAAQD